MKDKNGIDIKAGDIFFYSERPYSYYADSIGEIYENDGVLIMGTHVYNRGFGDGKEDEYVKHEFPAKNDVELKYCSSNDIEVIPISRDQVTIEYANLHYPLVP